jgi:hypothetical protein
MLTVNISDRKVTFLKCLYHCGKEHAFIADEVILE